MKKLDANWLTEGLIDFEYKKYLVLAYLQRVGNSFEKNLLYPHLGDLVSHYSNLINIRDTKNNVSEQFPKKLTGIDLVDFKLKYEKLMNDTEVMKEIEDIIDYSVPKFESYLKEGKELYDNIEHAINIYPVGVTPLYADEGYLFLKNGSDRKTNVYEYQITIFNSSEEQYRGIHTKYVQSYTESIANTNESIKKTLIKENKKLPNPATYLAETEEYFPLHESLLPIVKRCLVKYIATAA